MLSDLIDQNALARRLGHAGWAEVDALLSRSSYRRSSIRQKGRWRRIAEPSPELKSLQRRLARLLGDAYQVPSCVHGYVRGRSAITNAGAHVGKMWVKNVDIEQFFSSVTHSAIANALSQPPFNAVASVASAIASIATADGILPTGAPSSPVLSNMYLLHFDLRMMEYASRHEFVYTRYADDITVSSPSPNGWEISACEDTISLYLQPLALRLNPRKTRCTPRSDAQIVTGLVVNDRVNLRKRDRRRIKSQIYDLRRRGILWAAMRFQRQRMCRDARFGPIHVRRYGEAIFGRIQYVGAVRGFDDYQYLTLLCDFGMAVTPGP